MIDVIVPVYNNAGTLDETIQSVVRQSIFPDVAVHISDDCSQDASYEIARKWAARHDNIILGATENNLGVMGNYRRLLARCTGRYVAPIEGDDIWISNTRLEKLRSYLEAANRPACFSGFIIDDRIAGTQYTVEMMRPPRFRRFSVFDMCASNPPASFSNCLYRRDVFAETFADTEGAAGYDLLVNTLIAARHEGFDFYPEILSSYRISPVGAWSSLCSRGKSDLIVKTLQALREPLPRRYAATIDRCIRLTQEENHA